MKLKFYFFFVFVLLSARGFSQISISIDAPKINAPSPDVLSISVAVTSTNQLTSVVADVAGRTDTLTHYAGNIFKGTISLIGLSEGDTLTLTVTATDLFSNQQTATRNFIYDNPPTLKFVQPLDSFVGTPVLFFNIKVKDYDSCNIAITSKGNNAMLYQAKVKDSLLANVDLTPAKGSKGGSVIIEIRVTDKTGQTQNYQMGFYVVSNTNNPKLHAFYKAPKIILDFKDSSIFAIGETPLDPGIINIVTGSETLILDTLGKSPIQNRGSAFLTDYGAVFTGGSNIYDWNRDSLVRLTKSYSDTRFNNKYFGWSSFEELHLRDLSSKSNKIIATNNRNGFDIAENGLIVYATNAGGFHSNIWSYKDGVNTPLINDNRSFAPLTDGKIIVYTKGPTYDGPDSIYMYDGVNSTLLSTHGGRYGGANWYMIDNGFITFTDRDIAGHTQIFLRDTLGNIVQLTHSGTSSSAIENLNRKGDVVFVTDGLRYLSKFNDTIVQISTAIGKTYYVDSSWYVVLGNVIFKADTGGSLPLQLTNFTAVNHFKINELDWQTAQEINTAYFDVEHSIDAHNFNTIGTVQAAGNSSAPLSYKFIDAQHLLGINYYRLKMVDKDGRYSYSIIRAVKNSASDFSAMLYPNPVGNASSIQVNSDKAQHVTVEVIGVNGKVFSTTQLSVDKGITTQKINTTRLAPGTYMLRFKTNDGVTTVKFVKQ